MGFLACEKRGKARGEPGKFIFSAAPPQLVGEGWDFLACEKRGTWELSKFSFSAAPPRLVGEGWAFLACEKGGKLRN